MSYHNFLHLIKKNNIKTIFELGSRDLIDGIKLLNYFTDSVCYSFECNPDCLIECNKNMKKITEDIKNRLFLINKAISITNGKINFYPFDLNKYNNMGSSSLLKIDFTKRKKTDPDYNKGNVQKKIEVDGVRLDKFINDNKIKNIDLLCIDLQGYELNALKSLGNDLYNIKYIITECSIESTYKNGCSFIDLNNYLIKYNFKYICSNKFGTKFPNLKLKGFSEFDSLFININI